MQFATSISVTVPSTVNVNGAMSSDGVAERVQEVAQFFAAKFGGATAQPGQGFYVANNGDLIAEHVTIVTAFVGADNDNLPYLPNLMEDIAKSLCAQWEQECVLYTINNIGYLAFQE